MSKNKTKSLKKQMKKQMKKQTKSVNVNINDTRLHNVTVANTVQNNANQYDPSILAYLVDVKNPKLLANRVKTLYDKHINLMLDKGFSIEEVIAMVYEEKVYLAKRKRNPRNESVNSIFKRMLNTSYFLEPAEIEGNNAVRGLRKFPQSYQRVAYILRKYGMGMGSLHLTPKALGGNEYYMVLPDGAVLTVDFTDSPYDCVVGVN